jgi:hypothetical protein
MMEWTIQFQDPKKLHRVFAWFPIRVAKEEFSYRYVWLQTLYRVYDPRQGEPYWWYYTRKEAILERLLPGSDMGAV